YVSGTSYLRWEVIPQCKTTHHRHVIPFSRGKTVKSVVSPVTTPLPEDNAQHRKELCETYGFRQIGEPLPDNITLKNIIDTLPKEVFEIDNIKAWKSVLISATSYALGLFMISKFPWYLLPFAWAWTGTAVTGFFIIGHDCAHKSFSKNKLLEDIVGTLAFLPIIYPYEPWRFKHDKHHAKTNMLNEDTAWQPIMQTQFEESANFRNTIIYCYGPIRPIMSMSHCCNFRDCFYYFLNIDAEAVSKVVVLII
ncbi:omega-6 fatty acid desaturase, chloroplastic-like, partial [Bidens hawaiensis]|uniref:omega-6 fatty acid desaturase, chloroplastic-like n=1 Tax=Bidens hawaiensis TaxID=980011 RepID=UPI00404931B4